VQGGGACGIGGIIGRWEEPGGVGDNVPVSIARVHRGQRRRPSVTVQNGFHRVLPLRASDAQRLSILRDPSRLMRFCIGAQAEASQVRSPVSPSMSVCHPSTRSSCDGQRIRLPVYEVHPNCEASFRGSADLRGGMVKWPICDWIGFHDLAAGGP